jgi:hypothetical protein
MRRATLRSGMLLAALAAWALPAWAQQVSHAQAGVARVRVDTVAPGRGVPRIGGAPLGEAERRRWAPVASLILPGAGQALLHQDRFVAYLALEAWSVLEFANQRTEARRQRNRYQALAREVARSLYGPTHPVGTW